MADLARISQSYESVELTCAACGNPIYIGERSWRIEMFPLDDGRPTEEKRAERERRTERYCTRSCVRAAVRAEERQAEQQEARP